VSIRGKRFLVFFPVFPQLVTRNKSAPAFDGEFGMGNPLRFSITYGIQYS
jgi:hypothetical protein